MKRSRVFEMFNIAKKVALSSNTGKIRRHFLHGCCAVRQDGVIVASGNGVNPCPTENNSCHAESRCLRKAGRGSVLFVVRVGKEDGNGFKMSRPCKYCMSELYNRKVKKVYYTISDQEYGTILF